jgi:DNA-binding MarR family transcriptional regulator
MVDSNEEHETDIVRFTLIPEALVCDNSIDGDQKILLSEIIALSRQKGYCYATNKHFAKRYGVNVSTISRWLSKLETKGFIKRSVILKANSKEVSERQIRLNEEKKNIAELAQWYLQEQDEGICGNAILPLCTDSTGNNKFLNNTCLKNLKEPQQDTTNVFLSEEESKTLRDEFGKVRFEKCVQLYSAWKTEKDAHPASDFESLWKWLKKDSSRKTRSSTTVSETGADEVSEEELEDLPF